MDDQKTITITLSLPPNLVEALDRMRHRRHRSRSELVEDALARYLRLAEQSEAIPLEAALPEEVEAMRRAEEEHARGETVSLEDLQRELGLKTR